MIFLSLRTHTIQRVLTIILLFFFAAASLFDAGGMRLCFDKNEVHLSAQENCHQTSCHALETVQSGDLSLNDSFLRSKQNSQMPCVDVVLSTDDSSMPSQQPKKSLMQRSNEALASLGNSPSIARQFSIFAPAQNYQSYQLTSSFFALQTIVLLI